MSSGMWPRAFWFKCNDIGRGTSSRQTKKFALSKHVLDTRALRVAACFVLWWHRWQFALKQFCTSSRLHGVLYQKTFIFGASAMRTSNPTEIENVSVCVLDKLQPEEGSIVYWRRGHYKDLRQSYVPTLATPLNRLSSKTFNEEFWNNMQGVPFIKYKCWVIEASEPAAL